MALGAGSEDLSNQKSGIFSILNHIKRFRNDNNQFTAPLPTVLCSIDEELH